MGRTGEQDAQFELIFQVNVIETWFFMLVEFFYCYCLTFIKECCEVLSAVIH